MIAVETQRFVSRKPSVPARARFWLALAASLAVAFSPTISAQTTLWLDGVVLAPTGETVGGATVVVAGRKPAVTDENGRFSIIVESGEWKLQVTHPAYQTVRYPLTVGEASLELELRFETATAVEETITVIGIRAGDEVPVTKRNMDREEIETLSYGQDVPALLQYTPAMTWYSDSGVGSNYSYFSMRGIQQTRINMTFDGAPLNDPAEHAVYFNNFHDFANTVDSIQIQRGVGTSSVGSPSYGGSVNFASGPASPTRDGDLRLVLGSYDTVRASVSYESGVLDNGFSVSGRFSFADTDGYREHSGAKQRTLFFNTGWQGERSSLKLVSFFGNVETQLAFLAVDPETLSQNRRFNPLDEEERDDFGQDFAQLQYTRAFGDDTLLTASLYYNGADGWFRLWDDPETKTELLQFGIDQAFVGTMVTVSKSSDRLSTTLGVHYNDFSGDHTLDTAESRIYDNTGFKQTANAFGKIEYRLGQWLLFGDLQLRWAEFSYDGDVDLGSVDWTFLDPKIGARRLVSPQMSVYASLGRAQREPSRMDLLLGEDNATVPHDLEAVRPEEVLDIEVGIDLNTPRMALQANLYAMEFTDEIALTGELSEIGLPLRQNVDDSYRRGLEVDLKWMVTQNWSLIHSANLSRNRISEWTQFYDVYDEQGAWIGSEPITYRDVPPLLTPDVVINLGGEWAWRNTSVALMGRYVADSHLDNTGLDEFRLPAYTNLDLRASMGLGRWWSATQPKITLFVNNLFDNQDQYPSGYSYQFINRNSSGIDTLDGIPFYYPLATRNVVVSLELDL
jgi:iron complex outermembrane receptor protein